MYSTRQYFSLPPANGLMGSCEQCETLGQLVESLTSVGLIRRAYLELIFDPNRLLLRLVFVYSYFMGVPFFIIIVIGYLHYF